MALAQENIDISHRFLSWRKLQYFLAYIRRGQNMDSTLYIFSATSVIIYLQSTIKNNDEEERSSGTTGTGVSQKDLQISKKTKEEEKR